MRAGIGNIGNTSQSHSALKLNKNTTDLYINQRQSRTQVGGGLRLCVKVLQNDSLLDYL
jgi:hypothetical protein